ncbi:MAG: CpsB/CapC family capsule biosynthesis tyrosine phosphatase [Campylobacterota bacterium]|nr:CpsB/CapC family capsule biosynthesis tyrosine phosphatase [Campylobacterota bacterium]
MGNFFKKIIDKITDDSADEMFPTEHKTQLEVDLHSHLIPGIDDGAATIEDSIAMIWRLKLLGYKKLITTPHIMSHRYPNTSRDIKIALYKLQKELKRRRIDIKIEVAAEYYFDPHFIELLESRDILTFGNKHLLFEMSYGLRPVGFEEGIYKMKSLGYQPVLAHPERYLFMQGNITGYEKIKSLGVLFQMNINSLGGYYGEGARNTVNELISRGMVDFIGSDTHKVRHLERMTEVFKSMDYQNIFTHNTILNNSL